MCIANTVLTMKNLTEQKRRSVDHTHVQETNIILKDSRMNYAITQELIILQLLLIMHEQSLVTLWRTDTVNISAYLPYFSAFGWLCVDCTYNKDFIHW